jgi:hypothetical protein
VWRNKEGIVLNRIKKLLHTTRQVASVIRAITLGEGGGGRSIVTCTTDWTSEDLWFDS